MADILKHVFLILLITTIVVVGIFLPFMHGDYDYFAVGISMTIQFAAFTSLLFVPVGLIWCLLDFIKSRKSNDPTTHATTFRKITLGITVIIVLAAALGAFASQNRFSAIIILLAGPFILSAINKKRRSLQSESAVGYHVTPFYLILIPMTVIFIRLTFFETIKNQGTDFVIKQSEQLIRDIESYKKANGHYPVSLLSTIEDYKPNVSGIDRFHYERKGEAYNLYFEQFSEMLGTEEIVMYNNLDQHEMIVHNQDILRIPDSQIIRGYHKVEKLPQPHWKIFYFD